MLGDGWRLEGATLAVTVEPCTMCAGALVLARVARLVFGAWEPKTGAVGSLWDVVRDRRLNHRPQVRGGVLARGVRRAAGGFLRPAAIGVSGPRLGKLPGGGVSERPKEHASKACDGKPSEGSNPSATATTTGEKPQVVDYFCIGCNGRPGGPGNWGWSVGAGRVTAMS